MKRKKILVIFSVVFLFLLSASVVAAGDYDWIKNFNLKAEADRSGFRAKLSDRFKIDEAQINAVLNKVEKPADAYMIFRLAEMSAKPTDDVIEKYKSGKGKGWGVVAKNLGIKPGSKEFHALKRGNDIYKDQGKEKNKNKDKSKDKNKSKDKIKDKDKDKSSGKN